ncbi:hypothetical protein [Xanthocytophaga flava]|uniref:hypothetical protein n=1 Tax=Xanthocytophaga flava TaxID=3048013 RepID=UPI0028D8C1A6|nr:hypothetical protein [Xanthocytophaga flavus]MDJ1468196.1 hypothetical protein [Xanthocytophaga flavus]
MQAMATSVSIRDFYQGLNKHNRVRAKEAFTAKFGTSPRYVELRLKDDKWDTIERTWWEVYIENPLSENVAKPSN